MKNIIALNIPGSRPVDLKKCSRTNLLLVSPGLITDTDVDMHLTNSSSMAYHKPYIHTANTLTTYKLILLMILAPTVRT